MLGLAGLLRRSRKRHLALAGIVLNLSCLLWGWHALSTAAAAILMVLGQTGLSFLSALAVLFGMIFFRQAWTRSATMRRQPGRPPFGRSFIEWPHCGHSSRICRGRGSVGEGGRERSKGEPRRCGSPGSCGTVVRAPGRDQRWKG
ncbi:hypothetical protein P4114_16570 [Pseudomonas aeruginosa]|nr:hypothetical protein [Pseudomonas aeruginosa]